MPEDVAAKNKALVLEFYREVLGHGRIERIHDYLHEWYIQHNVQAQDGTKSLCEFIASVVELNSEESNNKVHRCVAEGDLVVVHSEVQQHGAPNGLAIIDIFRVEDGKIAEHWDVYMDIPEIPAGHRGIF
ncbi:ester cyclase [Sphingomonas canadensis]|uniref:Ester cyclase n=1 Tax=Sphingomonas canadensis TaxID=1219257 RepID=A0ABW3H6W8_9SPHN|nr:ester cyclase [Sphingomonas canadensis]MCW3834725.1 ester cyclase [Sphingomonas canadensis]